MTEPKTTPPLVTTELGIQVPVSVPKPSAWSGGEHSGERLTQEQRAQIRDLWTRGYSKLKISKELQHSRNTIAEVIDQDGEIGAHLRETRATRMLVEEEDLRRQRAEVMEEKADAGKLSVGDLNSAMMISSIAIKDAGGSAPQRIEVSVEHEFHAAATLMNGGARQPVSFAPVMQAVTSGERLPMAFAPVLDAELLPVKTTQNADYPETNSR
jgi:hypothetical protein